MKFFILVLLAVLAVSGKRLGGRIIGGTPVDLNVFPKITWQAGLIIGGTTLCGASLIDNQHLVTAAHCVREISTNQDVAPSQIEVKFGTDITVMDIYRGAQVWVFPTYSSAHQGTADLVDLAIIKLNYQVPFSPTVYPIALIQPSDAFPPASGKFVVSGYGATVSNAEGSSVTSDNLLWVEVPHVDKMTCQAVAPFIVPTDTFCAGGESGKDSCQGDSGGPAAAYSGTQENPTWYLAGVVSSGTAVTNPLCGVMGEYGIYTSIRPHLGWINSVLSGVEAPTSGAAKAGASLLSLLFVMFVIF